LAAPTKVIAIVGPTTSGKSSYALELAKEVSGEIVNADSRQIYKYIPIGTAQPDSDAKNLVPHHLYGFLEPNQSYNAGEYANSARKIILDILARKKTAIVVGGTGLYIKALFDGLSALPPKNEQARKELQQLLEVNGKKFLHEELEKVDSISAGKIPYQNSQRTLRALEVYRISGKPISQWHKESTTEKFSIEPKMIGLFLEKEQLRERIKERTKKIIPGMIEETKWLLQHNYQASDPGLNSLGYKHCFQYLERKISEDELFNQIYLDTLHYAKRQMTWFKKNQKIEWLSIRVN